MKGTEQDEDGSFRNDGPEHGPYVASDNFGSLLQEGPQIRWLQGKFPLLVTEFTAKTRPQGNTQVDESQIGTRSMTALLPECDHALPSKRAVLHKDGPLGGAGRQCLCLSRRPLNGKMALRSVSTAGSSKEKMSVPWVIT